MTATRTASRRDASRREGSIYLLVLCSALLVGTIGLSALLAVRIQRRTEAASEAAVKARVYAQAVIDLVHARIEADAEWRDTYDDDKWTDEESWGECTFCFKLDDEEDGSLDDDPSQSIRLHAKATVGSAVRIYSVVLRPADAPNLLANHGFEDGTTDWTSWNCTLVASGSAHTGNGCILLQNRGTLDATAFQYVTNSIEKDKDYYVEAWARSVSGTEMVTISLKTIASTSGTRIFVTGSTPVGTSWTKVAGTLTPTWNGTLTEARWRVFSYPDGASLDFYIDDAVLKDAELLARSMSLVPGTWRRETLP